MYAAPVVQEDVWAQCDNPACQKWRRLPPGTVVNEDAQWFCYMNPDPARNRCDLAEEAYNDVVEVAALPQPHLAPIAAPAPAKPKGKRKGTRHGLPVGELLRGDAYEEAIEIELKDRKARGRGRGRGRIGGTPPPALAAAPTAPAQPAEYAFGGALPPGKAAQAQEGFSNLLRSRGLWDGPAVDAALPEDGAPWRPPPVWLIESLRHVAPAASEAATMAADLASAAAYFERRVQRRGL